MNFKSLILFSALVSSTHIAFGQSELESEHRKEQTVQRDPNELKEYIGVYKQSIEELASGDVPEGVNVSAKKQFLQDMINEWEQLTGKKWGTEDSKKEEDE